MTHIADIIDALYLEHVSLIAGEIRIGLDILSHILKFCALLELYINHAAVDALTKRDSH